MLSWEEKDIRFFLGSNNLNKHANLEGQEEEIRTGLERLQGRKMFH